MISWTRIFTVLSLLPAICAAQNVVTTIAGNGISGFSGDGGAATSAELSVPSGVAVDSLGNVYIADSRNNRIRKVSPSGIITTVAGNGAPGYSGDGGPATAAELNNPTSVAVDPAGNLYIADSNNNRIRAIENGVIFTAVGNGTAGYSGDGAGAGAAELFYPYGVALDSSGNLYIADTVNARIRMVAPQYAGGLAVGTITTIAGTGVAGYTGDGAAATSAQIWHPNGVAVDGKGNLYIADTLNSRVRIVTTDGNIATFAGNGDYGATGDGGMATSATLSYPYSVAIDPAGNVYIADSSNEKVRVVSNGVITTYAGTGTSGYSGDGGPPESAGFTNPTGVAVNAAGNVVIADNGDSRVRLSAPAAPPAGPSITSMNSASAFGDFSFIAPGSWIEIYGSNLAVDSRPWNASDFVGLNGPTSLDGTSVTIGGHSAYLSYISPGQLNALAPPTLNAGSLPVIVTTPNGFSASQTVTVRSTAPGLLAPASFNIGGKQYAAAAITGTGAYALPPNAVAGVSSQPVQPGATITLYGVGFGPVTGSTGAGQIVQVANSLTLPLQVQIGGAPAAVSYAGSEPASLGLYQFDVIVPNVAAGSAVPLAFTLGGLAGTQTLYIAVQ